MQSATSSTLAIKGCFRKIFTWNCPMYESWLVHWRRQWSDGMHSMISEILWNYQRNYSISGRGYSMVSTSIYKKSSCSQTRAWRDVLQSFWFRGYYDIRRRVECIIQYMQSAGIAAKFTENQSSQSNVTLSCHCHWIQYACTPMQPVYWNQWGAVSEYRLENVGKLKS